MGSGGSNPRPRDLYTETSGELQARADLAPQVYATEATFRPQYNQLDLETLRTFLLGQPSGRRDEYSQGFEDVWRNTQTGEISTTQPEPDFVAAFTGNADPWQPYRRPTAGVRQVEGPDTPGFLDLYDTAATRVADIEARGLSTQRAVDIRDVGALGPESLAAAEAADPATAELINSMTGQASDELSLGTRLNPAELRERQQYLRARQAGTLGGTGTAGDFAEAMGLSAYGRQLQDRRRQFATGAVGLRSGVYGDAFNRVLGRPAAANASGTINQAYGISRGAGPRLFGSSISGANIADFNANQDEAARIADNNNQAATQSAAVSAAAAILAAII